MKCELAIGAALCQEFDGKLCAIHFASRSLIQAERNYSVQEKEALAIVFGVKKFRKAILGSRFKIRCLTDHKSLECLTNANEVAGRMARWAMIMSQWYSRTNSLVKSVSTPTPKMHQDHSNHRDQQKR